MNNQIKTSAIALVLWLLASGTALARPCGTAPAPACAVPEPSSLPLFVLGAVAAAVVARYLKKK